jgi:hypothetical protein
LVKTYTFTGSAAATTEAVAAKSTSDTNAVFMAVLLL